MFLVDSAEQKLEESDVNQYQSFKWILTGFVFFVSIEANTQTDLLQCNGNENLCGRPYNRASYLTAHNSQSYRRSWLLFLVPGSNIHNQTRDIQSQLNDGVRAMKMPVHYSDRTTSVCHGMGHWVKREFKRRFCETFSLLTQSCESWIEAIPPCWVDPGALVLSNAVKIIVEFLHSHPMEVITLFLEDDANDLEPIYSALQKSGAIPLLHWQKQDALWPTLGEMILQNHRLVVFVNRNHDQRGKRIEDFPGLNSMNYFVWSTTYHFDTVDDLRKDTLESSDLSRSAFLTRNELPQNKLWLLQHFVTPALAGNPQAAYIVNQPEILFERIERYEKAWGSAPNFISVDFYQLPSLNLGPLTVVHELNQGTNRRPSSKELRRVSPINQQSTQD
jgi:hypothetical protein